MSQDAKFAMQLMEKGCIAVVFMVLEGISEIHKEFSRKHKLTEKNIPDITGVGNLT